MDLKFKNMKKLFITAAIATMFSFTALADDGGKKNTNAAGVSQTALTHFATDFYTVTDVTWSVSANSQKATFLQDGVVTTAFYDLSGEFIGTTNKIEYATLTTDQKEAVAKKYAGYDVVEVIRFNYAGASNDVNPIVYFIDLKKGDSEVVLKTAPNEGLSFYKKIK
ncbi:hypothetical protein GCM10027049_15880 [Mucilaginibacter puniceus]